MARCPYATQLWRSPSGDDGPATERILTRCVRRAILVGWHLHAAVVPEGAPRGVWLRWRSSASPDFHVEYERGSADRIIE